MDSNLPVRNPVGSDQPIECEAVPLDTDARGEARPPVSISGLSTVLIKWVFISFLLIFALKLAGAVILLAIAIKRFPLIMRAVGDALKWLRR